MASGEVNSVPHTGSLKLMGLKLLFLSAVSRLSLGSQFVSGKLGLLCRLWLLIAMASLIAELGL